MLFGIEKNMQGAVLERLLEFPNIFLKQLKKTPKEREYSKEVIERLDGSFFEEDLNEITSMIKEGGYESINNGDLTDYVKRMNNKIVSNISHLKTLYRMDHKNPEKVFPLGDPLHDKIADLEEEGEDMMSSIIGAYNSVLGACLYKASQVLTPQGYILTTKEKGIIPKNLIGSPDELFSAWVDIMYHAPFNIGVVGSTSFAKYLDEVIKDNERWLAITSEIDTLPVGRDRVELGRRLFEFGLENRVYASELPHKIILNHSLLDSLTARTNKEGNFALFKAKRTNKQVSVGIIGFWEENFGFAASTLRGGNKLLAYNFADKEEEFLCPIVGAILRDMYVCEERIKLYSEGIEGKVKAKRRKSKPTVIWLPRTKITYLNLPENTDSITEKIIQEVAATNVTGYTRKCNSPSPAQLELAKAYGVIVPHGKTFVRPHPREGYTRSSPDYKSRSALQVLFGSR